MPDDMRDRLAELINEVIDHLPWGEVGERTSKELADHLLPNGVILPPVEVGQTVWYIEGGYYRKTGLKAKPKKVTEINLKWCGKTLAWGFIASGTRYRFSSIGKTVFLTKEDAEKALFEREFDKCL